MSEGILFTCGASGSFNARFESVFPIYVPLKQKMSVALDSAILLNKAQQSTLDDIFSLERNKTAQRCTIEHTTEDQKV